MKQAVIAIHGGAGTLRRADISAEQEAAYRATLVESLAAGEAVLARGGAALDAVEAAVRVMEDSPLFNAGRGAVFTHDGRNELDAAIMNGATLEAGAIAGVTRVKNPVTAARRVMEQSGHVLLIGSGAEKFVELAGGELVDPEYFKTDRRWGELQRALAAETMALSEDSALGPDRKFGTVGAVALDCHGHIAAATSTGGMTNKRYGRVGDSPVIGAGTWAEDSTCAVSCTGHGEFFIRANTAGDVAARMRYLQHDLAQAADGAIERLGELGGRGGLVSLDGSGRVHFAFNTEGMYRGAQTVDGTAEVAIYK
ncbi:MAG: isoaspartyl peptidase/L-asparaginase [Burkholderiaceae bacterium]